MSGMSGPIDRPRRAPGPVAEALLDVATEPGTVRQLAERAQVGRRAAWYTVTRLVQRGQLVVVESGRPAVLRRRQPGDDAAPIDLAKVLSGWR